MCLSDECHSHRFGIESRTDLNGDGKEDRVRVIDRRDAGFTTIIANVNGVDVAIKDYRGYFESTVTTGDLTGNGKADVLLKSATRGTDSGTVNILHSAFGGYRMGGVSIQFYS